MLKHTYPFRAAQLLYPALAALLTIVLTGPQVSAAEEIYVEDEDGVPSFSDRSTKTSEKVEVQAPMIFDSKNLVPRDLRLKDDEPPPPKPIEYKLEITSPADDSAIRDNAGNLTLSVRVLPSPAMGHTAELLMDGQPVRRLAGSGDVSLTNVDRGTHQFQVRIVDDTGNTVSSSSVSRISMLRFFIRRNT